MDGYNILTTLFRKSALTIFLTCIVILSGADAGAATDLRTLNLSLLEAAKKGQSTIIASKLREGASVHARDRFGNTALIYAARVPHIETARVLVEAGAKPEQANVNGNTPLFEAAGSGDIELVRFLLQHGADMNVVTMKQVSPLANAIYHERVCVAEFLLQRGAKPGFIDNTGKNSAVYAAASGATRVLRIILDMPNEPAVAVDVRYAHELTLLMWAAGYGNVDTVEMLVNRGAAFDLTDDRGKSALMMAAENGHADVVSFLLNSGADADVRDIDGRTARDLAEKAGRPETVAMPD